MNLIVNSPHLQITPAIHRYTQSRITRTLKRFKIPMTTNISLSVRHQREQGPHINVHCRFKGKEMFAQAQHTDFYTALDRLFDKLDRQIAGHKNRLADYDHQSLRNKELECSVQ